MKGSFFLISISIIMFSISTLFLAKNVADLILHLRTTLNANMALSFEDKVAMADHRTKRLMMMAQMLFTTGVCQLFFFRNL
jgi:hypothetical protein